MVNEHTVHIIFYETIYGFSAWYAFIHAIASMKEMLRSTPPGAQPWEIVACPRCRQSVSHSHTCLGSVVYDGCLSGDGVGNRACIG